jgi:hypothetical protein
MPPACFVLKISAKQRSIKYTLSWINQKYATQGRKAAKNWLLLGLTPHNLQSKTTNSTVKKSTIAIKQIIGIIDAEEGDNFHPPDMEQPQPQPMST